MTRHRQSSQEHSRWQGKVVLLGYSRALGPPESRRPGEEASLGSRLHVQPVRERERPRGRQPARPSEPGLPIVNIYLTSVTPARHRCLLPPPPFASRRALPSATGRGRATSLRCGLSALGAGARRGRPGAGALRSVRAALLLPGGRRAALQINASPSSRVSEGGRSRRRRRL